MQKVKQQIEQCIEALRQDELTEADLSAVLDAIDETKPKRQNLLYLQTGGTSVGSGAHGCTMVVDGQIAEPPDQDNWPYNSPIDAMRDGWRIIEFPNLALLMDESRTYGLGCEFILEKWE